MWIISKSRLREFWERPGMSASQGPLTAWFRHVELASWQHWQDVKQDFRSADLVGNCTVYNISGNKYRLITKILFESHKVFILRVMTHVEYDKANWQLECGCYSHGPAVASKQTRRNIK
jgi:mRNA interferase HigB